MYRLVPSPQRHRGFVGPVLVAQGFPCRGGQCSCLHRQGQGGIEVADVLAGFELCHGAQEDDGSGWQDEAPPRADVLLDGLTDPRIH